jgi:hypothetical protein
VVDEQRTSAGEEAEGGEVQVHGREVRLDVDPVGVLSGEAGQVEVADMGGERVVEAGQLVGTGAGVGLDLGLLVGDPRPPGGPERERRIGGSAVAQVRPVDQVRVDDRQRTGGGVPRGVIFLFPPGGQRVPAPEQPPESSTARVSGPTESPHGMPPTVVKTSVKSTRRLGCSPLAAPPVVTGLPSKSGVAPMIGTLLKSVGGPV